VQLVLVVLLVIALAGAFRYVTRDRSCFPGRPHAAPTDVRPGEDVVVTATGFTCARRFHAGAFYGLELVPQHGEDSFPLGDHGVERDGSFHARVTIPDDAPAGPATLRFTGFDVDELYDEVCSEQRCGSYAAGVVVG
jgi:hypothetical protein